MATTTTEELAVQAIRYLGTRNLPALFDLMHDEGTWSVPYSPDRFAFGGTWGKTVMRDVLTAFQGTFQDFAITPTTVVASEDRAVVEAVGSGTSPGGARYTNTFCFVLTIRDGKVQTVREFFDPFEILAYVEQLPEEDVQHILAAAG
jgi:hypothetical protein